MTCGNYIQRLIDGDNSAMDDIYRSFRGGFLSFAHSSLGLKWDDASDLFQDAVICLMQNVQRGKLTALENHKVGAYLYTAGKYIRNNRLRKAHLPLVVWDSESDCAKIIENLPETEDDSQEKEKDAVFSKEETIRDCQRDGL